MIVDGNRSSLIVWVLVAIVASLVAVAIASMAFLAATTAYVAGESLWSKAQKDAVHHLVRYAASRDEADFREYRERLAVILGDRAARLEMEKPRLDREAVYRGLPRAVIDKSIAAGKAIFSKDGFSPEGEKEFAALLRKHKREQPDYRH